MIKTLKRKRMIIRVRDKWPGTEENKGGREGVEEGRERGKKVYLPAVVDTRGASPLPPGVEISRRRR